MSSVLPVCLAAGETVNADGTGLLAGVVMGVETAARLGTAMRGLWTSPQGAGFLPSTIIGGFGATAAGCRILRLSIEETVHALGIYYAQDSGNRQALYDKTLTKRIQPALAARSALWAVHLAKQGITGPHNAIEGSAGLIRIYADSERDIDPDSVRQNPGRFQIEQVAVKRFPSCGACHPLTQAALDLAHAEDLVPDEIAEAEIYMGEGENKMVGMPFSIGDNPQVNAQFCAAYGAALGLIKRKAGLSEYTDEQVRKNTEVAELARNIRILTHMDDPPEPEKHDDTVQAWVDQPHVLRIKTRDGNILQQVSSIRKVLSPESTSFEDVIGKFHECAAFSGVCTKEQADKIIKTVENLGTSDTCTGLIRACTFNSC
jgi:2-methylcitrate dehydratase PrpD